MPLTRRFIRWRFMRLLSQFLLILLFSINCHFSYAHVVTIGLEPFPPFVDQSGKGLTINLLKEVERISSFKFDIEVMTYARAKHELKNNRLTIAGHTPKGNETSEFYQYAEELDWQIDTTADVFAFDVKYLESKKVVKGKLGTTLGNAEFFAEMLGISKDKFVEVSSLNQLVDMFIVGRLDAILFERASVMTLLQKKQIPHVHYRSIGVVPASIAVKKSPQGKALKAKLDALIERVNTDEIFSSYLKYTRLPNEGVVPRR